MVRLFLRDQPALRSSENLTNCSWSTLEHLPCWRANCSCYEPVIWGPNCFDQKTGKKLVTHATLRCEMFSRCSTWDNLHPIPPPELQVVTSGTIHNPQPILSCAQYHGELTSLVCVQVLHLQGHLCWLQVLFLQGQGASVMQWGYTTRCRQWFQPSSVPMIWLLLPFPWVHSELYSASPTDQLIHFSHVI